MRRTALASLVSLIVNKPLPQRTAYEKPALIRYGRVTQLTRGGQGSGNDTGAAYMNMGMVMGMGMGMSDVRTKQDIVRIGTHPLGFGLYLFHYVPAFTKPQAARIRQFGVLAHEVEPLVPDAVHRDERGYRTVDYARLGILRTA